MATDPVSGTSSAEPVQKVWVNHDTDLLDVHVAADGVSSTIHSTRHHPFWDLSRHKWVEAEDLPAGDRLYSADGSIVTVMSTVVVPGAKDMWDLTVGVDHDFYVVLANDTGATDGTAAGATTLVHNCPVSRGMNNAEAKAAAADLGYSPVKGEYVHGQQVFKNGNSYISADADGHSGGVWKGAKSIKDLRNGNRTGTYDSDLNRIGD